MRNKRILICAGVMVLCVLTGVGWWFFAGKSGFGFPEISLKKAQGIPDLVPLAIVGSGPAGLSAALYGARFNIYTVVFEGKRPGGQLMSTSDVENWPAMGRELGPHIIEKLRRQAAQFGALMSPLSVEKLDCATWPYTVHLDDGTKIRALAVIMATGALPVKLQVPGEQEYWGKGVTSCAVCDAPFFKNKKVFVVGGGDAAVEEALQLAAHASEIIMLVRADKMRASYAMQQRIKAYPKISVQYRTQVKEIKGAQGKVSEVVVESPEGRKTLPADGVFLAIGHVPNSELVKDILNCDPKGYIRVAPQRQITSQPGVFAAGDVADFYYRQAGIASGDGIKAAIDAAAFLREHDMDDAALTTLRGQLYEPPASGTAAELESLASLEQFDALINEAKGAVVVDFYTPTCPNCQHLMPLLARAVAEQRDGSLKAIKVDGSVFPAIMERYGVTSVPTVLIFKAGLVVGRSTHLSSYREVKMLISQFTA